MPLIVKTVLCWPLQPTMTPYGVGANMGELKGMLRETADQEPDGGGGGGGLWALGNDERVRCPIP